MRRKQRSDRPRPTRSEPSGRRLLRMLALAVLGSSVLVGISSGTAGALITVTGHITLYSLSGAFFDGADYPGAISGSPGGDVWFVTNPSALCRGCVGDVARITTGGVLDGSAYLQQVGPDTGLNILATDSSGGAYYTDGGVPAQSDSGLHVSESTVGNPLGPVAVSGSTPFWGASPGYPTDELYSGFPTVSATQATAAPVTSLVTGTSGEIDMMLGPRDYAFYYLGTLTVCDGAANTIFPTSSSIVSLASGSAGIWFADSGRNSIWQYDGSCQGTEHPVPDGTTPRDITEGSDGNVYFTTSSGIWELIPSSGVFYKYTSPGLVDPEGITLGGDGNIWFSDTNGQQIGKLVPYVASNPYATLHEWVLPTGSGNNPCVPCHWMGVNLEQVPSGYGGETDIGYVYQDPGPGLEALYACTDGGQGDYLSLDPTGGCADGDVPPAGPPPTNLGVQGYVYQSAPTDGTDALALYQCYDSGVDDWLATTVPPGSAPAGTPQPCGEDPSAYVLDDALGYVVNPGPPAATPEVSAVPLLAAAGATVMGAALVLGRRRRRSAPASG